MKPALNTMLFIAVSSAFALFAAMPAQANIEPTATTPEPQSLFTDPTMNRDYSYNYKLQHNVEEKVQTLTSSLFGDQMDLASGSVRFSQTDISLPGNFALDVGITRTLSSPDTWYREPLGLGNWSIDLPHIRSNYVTDNAGNYLDAYWPNGLACSSKLNTNPDFHRLTGTGSLLPRRYSLHALDYWNGDHVYIPGQGTTTLLNEEADTTYKRHNNKQWEVSCWDDPEQPHEGFKVTTGDGTSYYFSQQRVVTDRQKLSMTTIITDDDCLSTDCQISLDTDSGSEEFKLNQHYIFMLITKVEDKFGNRVDYTYNVDGALTRIEATDGRLITLTSDINGDRVMTANGRTWRYKFDANEALSEVVLPNSQKWTFNNGGDIYGTWREWFPPHSYYGDECINTLSINRHFITMTHPYGMQGEFNVDAHCFGQSDVPRIEKANRFQTAEQQSHWVQRENRTIVLDDKVLTFPDGTIYTWDYQYSNNKGLFDDETANSTHTLTYNKAPRADLKSTTVTHPNGDYEVNYFDRTYGRAQNNLLYKEVYNGQGNLLQRQSWTYSYSPNYGTNRGELNITYARNSFTKQKKSWNNEQLTRTDSITTELFTGASNSTSIGAYVQRITDYDTYNQPTLAQGSSNGNARYLKFGYLYDLANGVFTLPTTVQVSDTAITDATTGLVSKTTYKNLSSSKAVKVPDEVSSFGLWRQRFAEYHTTGTATGSVKKVEFNAPMTFRDGNRYVEYLNYKRGTAQEIRVPARYGATGTQSIRQSVDNNGWVTSITDFNGNTTGYGYDQEGRLAYINRPGTWLDSVYAWSQPAGQQPKRTLSRCAVNTTSATCSNTARFTSETQFDSLLRPLQIKNSAGDVHRYQNKTFDHYGNETFTSYWLSTPSTTNGTTRTFDALSRVRRESQTDGGTQSVDYLSGNRMRTTDAEGNITTSTYQAWGKPMYEQVTYIDSPEGVTTTLDVDEYGLIHSITQAGGGKSETEYRAYNNHNQHCKTVREDVGQTIFINNALGQKTRQIEGVVNSGSSATNTNCLYTDNPDAYIDFVYDNLGDSHQVNYANAATPDVAFTYDNQGNLRSLVSGNVTKSYEYNSLHLLDLETQSFAGAGIDNKSWSIDYAYDNLGNLSALTYPDNDVVSFTPNGFGEPTQAVRARVEAGAAEATHFNYATSARYYANGMLDTFNYGNGLTHKTTLNSRQMPESIKDSLGISNFLHYGYSYDNNLNITSLFDYIDSSYTLTSLTYDGLDRLTRTTGNAGIGSSIAYDALGNITRYSSKGHTLTYEYNAANRLQSVNDTGTENRDYLFFEYDNRGNVTNNSYHNFTYNRANQMVASGSHSYLYDGHNRRVKQTDSNGTSYSFYTQDGTLIYRENEDGGTNYIYLGKKLIAKDGYIKENASKQHFRPFGSSIEGETDDVGYTGHKFDKTLGLSYMQARYYDPIIGRFYGNDPVDVLGHMSRGNPVHGFGRFTYVNNNPYKYTDPDGEFGTNFGNTLAQSLGYRNISHANKQLNSDLSEAGGEIAGAVAEAAGTVSDAATLGAVVSAAAGQLEISAPLATVAVVAGFTEAALGDNPVKDLAVETVATVTGAKAVGTVAKIAEGVADKSEGTTSAIKTVEEVAKYAVSESIKDKVDE